MRSKGRRSAQDPTSDEKVKDAGDDKAQGGGQAEAAPLNEARERMTESRRAYKRGQDRDAVRGQQDAPDVPEDERTDQTTSKRGDAQDEDEEPEGRSAVVHLPKPTRPFHETKVPPAVIDNGRTSALAGWPFVSLDQGLKLVHSVLRDLITRVTWPSNAHMLDDKNEDWILQQNGWLVAGSGAHVTRYLPEQSLVGRMARDASATGVPMLDQGVSAQSRGPGGALEQEGEASASRSQLCKSLELAHQPVHDTSSRPEMVSMEETGLPKPVPAHLVMSTSRPALTQGMVSAAGEIGSYDATLHVVLSRIALYDHPLFAPEDQLFGQLRIMYGEYKRRLEEMPVAPFLAVKLSALVEALQRIEVDDQDSVSLLKSLRRVHDETIAALLDLLECEKDLGQLTRALYDTWKELMRERDRVGFKRTPAHLLAYRARRSSTTPATVPLVGILDDIAREMMRLLERWSSLWIKDGEQLRSTTQDDAGVAGSAKMDFKAAAIRLEGLIDACKAVLPRDDQPDYLLKLTEQDKEFLNAEELPPSEALRRQTLQKDTYYAVIKVNGKVVARTGVRNLEWPHFVMDFHKAAHIWMVRRPGSLSVELWQKRSFIDQLVGRIMVPVPGRGRGFDRITTDAVAPKVAWFQFASADELKLNTAGPRRRVTGAALIGVEWELARTLDSRCEKSPQLPARPRSDGPSRMQGSRFGDISETARTGNEAQGAHSHSRTLVELERDQDLLQMLPDMKSIDPNDPRNANLLRFRDILSSTEDFQNRFRTVESLLESSFSARKAPLADYRMFEEARRHELIRLRAVKADALTGPIPIDETVVRSDERYRALILAERKLKWPQYSAAEKDDAEAASEVAARKGADKSRLRDFVRRVRESRSARLQTVRRRRASIATIVQEDFMPEMASFELDLSELLPVPKRSLRPAPKTRMATAAAVKSCRILIQVVLARNLPVRQFAAEAKKAAARYEPTRSKKRRKPRRDEDEENSPEKDRRQDAEDDEPAPDAVRDEVSRLQCFVEVRFQDHMERTGIAEGRTPIWKESVSLPFVPPMNDFSPHVVAQVRDAVTLSLFDNVRVDERSMGGFYPEEETIRTEKRFLGSLTIPFSTIYSEGRIDGTFRLETPVVNLGYERAREAEGDARVVERKQSNDESTNLAHTDLTSSEGDPSAQTLLSETQSASYVNVMATLEPLLKTPAEDSSGLVLKDIKEDKQLLMHGVGWLEKARAKTQGWFKGANRKDGRHFKLFVPKMEGDGVLISRFLRAQAPPPGVTTVRHCVRFVSLIPFIEDWQAFVGEGDIWCTSQQFLELLAGDFEEHAVMLHNFLSHLATKEDSTKAGAHGKDSQAGSEVYLALGHGIPEGKTCYVMTRRKGGDIIFWNPVTGEGYSSQDERCPLQDIGMLVGQSNIYANLQRPGPPLKLKFELQNSEQWLPFFSQTFPRPAPSKLPSVQSPSLHYFPTSKTFVLELEEQLQDNLKRHIRRWRARRSNTSFNGEVSGRLLELLPMLEKVKRGETVYSREEHERKLEGVLRQRDVFGMPLNAPFTDIGEIVQRVRSTGTHDTKNPDAQFALAVSVFPHSNNVLSVWVYFVVLIPKVTLAK